MCAGIEALCAVPCMQQEGLVLLDLGKLVPESLNLFQNPSVNT